jgi:DNA-binding transcriptional ArsR family regulator
MSDFQRPLTDGAANVIAERLRVLGQPLRVKLVDRLAVETTTVQELVDALGTTQQNISKHMGVLRRAGIVVGHKAGTRVRYRLASPDIVPILERAEASLADEPDYRRTDSSTPRGRAGINRKAVRPVLVVDEDARDCDRHVPCSCHRGGSHRPSPRVAEPTEGRTGAANETRTTTPLCL